MREIYRIPPEGMTFWDGSNYRLGVQLSAETNFGNDYCQALRYILRRATI